MSYFTYSVKEGYHESEEESEYSSMDKSDECTDVEEVDAQGSSDTQSTSAKVSCCMYSFPIYSITCMIHLQSHFSSLIASASKVIPVSENVAAGEVSPVKDLHLVAQLLLNHYSWALSQ